MAMMQSGRISHFLAGGGRSIVLASFLLSASIETWSGNSVLSEIQVSIADTAGWNLFSVEQDMQLGSESAARLEENVLVVQESELSDFFDRLGARLSRSVRHEFPSLSYRLIADESLHAFAFPGGPLYCSTGMMAAAESEAQLAGLVAHLLAHIVLRDSTSKASLADRFRVRAAMAAASTGKKTLLTSLEEISLYLRPGSDLMRYDTDYEKRADWIAENLMVEAGYDPAAGQSFFKQLHDNHAERATFFLQRHPVQEIAASRGSPSVQGNSSPLVSKRKFRRLRKQAASIQRQNGGLESFVNWQPISEQAPVPSGPREVYLTSRYSVSYSAAWSQAKSSEKDLFQATPKGGAIRQAGGMRVVNTGVIAGTTALDDPIQAGRDQLVGQVAEIRPGLALIGKLEHAIPASKPLEGLVFRGKSPSSDEPEVVWAIGARLPDRMFFLLLIAPEKSFEELEPEFEKIIESVEFFAYPANGQVGVRGQEGFVN